jgi:two-component system chemotaxis family response regulator WspR
MAKKTQILLVEDDKGHARLVSLAFRHQPDPYQLDIAYNLKEAEDYLSSKTPDIVIADLLLPDGRGTDLLKNKSVKGDKTDELPFPLVVMTSHGDEQIAVDTMKAGAMDYVVKTGDALKAMPRVVQRILREWGHIVKEKKAEEQLKQLNKQLKEANRKLERLANYDALTGVANRHNFMESFENEWKRGTRNKLPLSLIMIDVDFFKAYNDNYGHQAGDECLKRIASLLQETLTRTGDILARYGGEEFVVILPETNSDGAKAVAEKLRKKIESARIPHAVSAIHDYITISLGTATAIPKRKESDTLIAAADNALYQAKKKGRNRFEVADFQ